MTVQDKLTALRGLMQQEGLSAYIVPSTDPHASEYMASHWTEVCWLTSFTGEAGTAVVTSDRALLWTDSRYYLQAGIELEGTTVSLMRESDIDCPKIAEWLISNLPNSAEHPCVGVNPQMWSVDGYKKLKEQLAEAGIGLKSVDLIRPLWKTVPEHDACENPESRPAIPTTPFYEFDTRYAGESVHSKLQRIRAKLHDKKADAMVVSALDEIAWVLNIRGNDVEYNPVVISYLVLEQDKCTLFVLPEKVTKEVSAYLRANDITIKDYGDVFAYLGMLNGTILYDGAKVNEALYEAINAGAKKVNAQSPILVAKSHKNDIELAGVRRAMEQDAVALTRFFRWLESKDTRDKMAEGKLTEWDLMEQLHQYRLMGKTFTEESFGTIAGYQGNGAIVHYAATEESAATVYPKGMLLLDSGGQYLDGTTDITRTVWLGGDIPAQAKRDYTYVLKGHLMLGHIRWPRGTRGNQIDALAKQYMWQAGITYGHGTGHGVGHFLGCHEGPQNIRTDMNPTVLEPGQICSDEPGIYRTGKWGIRTENLVVVTPVDSTKEATTEDEWLTWETLTLCPYDTTLIDFSLLTKQERQWLNDYHAEVYRRISPLLNEDEALWLADKCKAI